MARSSFLDRVKTKLGRLGKSGRRRAEDADEKPPAMITSEEYEPSFREFSPSPKRPPPRKSRPLESPSPTKRPPVPAARKSLLVTDPTQMAGIAGLPNSQNTSDAAKYSTTMLLIPNTKQAYRSSLPAMPDTLPTASPDPSSPQPAYPHPNAAFPGSPIADSANFSAVNSAYSTSTRSLAVSSHWEPGTGKFYAFPDEIDASTSYLLDK